MIFWNEVRENLINKVIKEKVDIVVVGGGITGAGILRDATTRGLKCLLVEKNDFAGGTSSASSKLIHGGLRYLAQGNIKLVFESTQERAKLMKLAPNIVEPVQFLFPVYKGEKPSIFALNIGLFFYDLLGSFKNFKMHRRALKSEIMTQEPYLKNKGLIGGALYYDCVCDDARLTLENIISGYEAEGVPLNYVHFKKAIFKNGKIFSVVLMDEINSKEFEVECRLLIISAGHWTDEVLSAIDEGMVSKRLRPTKGIHLVFEKEKLPVNHAIVMKSITDERILFVIPWGKNVILGTTDTDYDGNLNTIKTLKEDALYLLSTLNNYFPAISLKVEDVVSTWAGLRPLVKEESVHESSVSRDHSIWFDKRNIAAIAGGKLTTYRIMARDILDISLHKSKIKAGRCGTSYTPLFYSSKILPKWHIEDLKKEAINKLELREDSIYHIFKSYGFRCEEVFNLCRDYPELKEKITPHLPYILAEIPFSLKNEMTLTLIDFLKRRTQVFYRCRDNGLSISYRVAKIMGKFLNWSDERLNKELNDYKIACENNKVVDEK